MRARILATLCAILISILTTGCFVRSLHPIYTEQDIVFEPDLVGRWNDNDEALWAFSRGDGNSYDLVITDDEGHRDPFIAHLVKIEGNLFLDLLPRQTKLEGTEFYKSLFLPVHTFCYIKQIEPALQMCAPDPDWLEKLLAESPDAIRHEKIQEKIAVPPPSGVESPDAAQRERIQAEIILTAPTKDLQAFLIEHLHDKGAFGEPSNMKRLE
ncbi:MAG: hypothetical protein JXR49_14245 [Acidobacteria bacterium]|nr:hypothetical protein [Acidobacteriota bacterium]